MKRKIKEKDDSKADKDTILRRFHEALKKLPPVTSDDDPYAEAGQQK